MVDYCERFDYSSETFALFNGEEMTLDGDKIQFVEEEK